MGEFQLFLSLQRKEKNCRDVYMDPRTASYLSPLPSAQIEYFYAAISRPQRFFADGEEHIATYLLSVIILVRLFNFRDLRVHPRIHLINITSFESLLASLVRCYPLSCGS